MAARFILPAIGMLALTACATDPVASSYIGGSLSATDSAVIARAVDDFVAARVPPASSTLVIAPATVARTAGTLTALPESVADDLRRTGYGIAPNSGPVPAEAHIVRYLVTPLDGAVLLRVTIDGTEVSQIFGRTNEGVLFPASPPTELEAS